jgi:hypothetical protein
LEIKSTVTKILKFIVAGWVVEGNFQERGEE